MRSCCNAERMSSLLTGASKHCVSRHNSVSTPPAPSVIIQPSGAVRRILTSTSATIPVTVCSAKNSVMLAGIEAIEDSTCSPFCKPTATAPDSLLWARPRPLRVMGKPILAAVSTTVLRVQRAPCGTAIFHVLKRVLALASSTMAVLPGAETTAGAFCGACCPSHAQRSSATSVSRSPCAGVIPSALIESRIDSEKHSEIVATMMPRRLVLLLAAANASAATTQLLAS